MSGKDLKSCPWCNRADYICLNDALLAFLACEKLCHAGQIPEGTITGGGIIRMDTRAWHPDAYPKG